jgi:predicted permease
MSSVLSTILGVFGYVLIGYILKKLHIVPNKLEQIFTSISFNVLLPIALITNFWLITFPDVFIIKLLISFFGAGIIIFILSFLIGKHLFLFKVDDSALFGLGACFGNSVALGIPLMYSILGAVKTMPYMILVLFHGIIHFTYTTLIIESYRNRNQSNLKKVIFTIVGLAQNAALAGMVIGFALNYFSVPFPESLQKILLPLTNTALPTVLVAMGMGLAGFKIISDSFHFLILTILKNFVYPMIAFVLAKYVFLLSPLLVFIVTMAAALPSGTQTYYFSYRYNSLQNIISANVVVSTFVSFFTLSILLFLFGY